MRLPGIYFDSRFDDLIALIIESSPSIENVAPLLACGVKLSLTAWPAFGLTTQGGWDV